MARKNRNPPGGYVYHVMNRGNRRATLFETDRDFLAFLEVMRESLLQVPMRIIDFCLMGNHWHQLLWPREDGDLAGFMHHLTTTHAMRWNKYRGLTGTGHVYQGPYQFFPVQGDDHYFTVSRYVVRNAARANLVARAKEWPHSSLHARYYHTEFESLLSDGPLPYPSNWLEFVNRPQSEAELAALRLCVQRSQPFDSPDWQQDTASQLNLEHTLRSPGRPCSRPPGGAK